MDRVRLATAADGAAIAGIYAPIVRDTAISFEAVPPAADEMSARITATSSFAPWLVSTRAGEIAGYAYAARHRERAAYQWSVDVSVYVAAAHHRRGVARALYQVLFRLLALQGFHTAHAGIALPNPASVALHESLGFVPIGIYPSVGWKHGAWRDVGWWRLPLRPTIDAPAPPRSPAELAGVAAWDDALAGRGA